MRLTASMLIFAVSLFTAGCSNTVSREATSAARLAPAVPSPTPSPTPNTESRYPGIAIDEVFPILYDISFANTNGKPPETFKIDNYTVRSKDFIPVTLEVDGKPFFKFPKRQEDGTYWATLAGVSHLRGTDLKELYVVVMGPGAVCCTNYTIVDVSSSQPRSLYQSEDFGRFRDPMEVFDADNDGIYELMQWDSCLRYFQGDCGSCSPEPRVHFKYRKDLGKYMPAKGIVQDFVGQDFIKNEKWLDEKYAEWRGTNDVGLRVNIRHRILAYAADLLHIGEEKRGWALFTKYSRVVEANDKRDLQLELRTCKAYQFLKAMP